MHVSNLIGESESDGSSLIRVLMNMKMGITQQTNLLIGIL